MFTIAAFALGAVLIPAPRRGQDAIVVAPNGNDKSGTGAPGNPYATLGRALPRARAGDTVIVRGGVYPATKVNVTLNGAAATPITIRAFPKEVPVLDGAGGSFGTYDSVLNLHKSNHVVIDGLEVRNSPGGITLHECTHVTVRNCSVHDVQYRAIGGSGDRLLIENNKVWNACLMNADNGQFRKGIQGMWPATVSTWKRADGGPSTNVTFRGNEVRECWGEGIDGFFLDGGAIEGNTVRDCYSVLVYCDTARNIRIDRNYLHITTDRFYRGINDKQPATGISLSMEHYEKGPDITIENIVISNNLILGTLCAINHWRDARNTKPSNTYRNLTICHNVVAETKWVPMGFNAVPAGYPEPSRCVARNNIFFKGGLSIGNPAGWSFSHNCWPDGIPAAAKDQASIAADPRFVKPVRGGPPEGYKLTAASPCLGRGAPVPAVTADFWGTPRKKTNPTIGIHEPGAK